MKAVRVLEYGGPLVFDDVPAPTIARDEILVRIKNTLRPDVATVYALQDATQAWKDIAGNLPWVHGMSPTGTGAARRTPHGKIVLRVA